MSTLNSDSVDKSSESAGSYSFVHDQKPSRGNSSISDLLPDAKWWLNHHGLVEKGYSLDQLNVLEADAKKLVSIYVNGNTKGPAENKLVEDYCNSDPKKVGAFSLDIPLKHFCSNRKSNGDSWFEEFESTVNDDMISNAHVMGMDSCNCLLFERPEKLCSDLDSHWIGVEKIEPWWHAVDKDDLASLISQTSSHCIRNCDHPGVQSMHFEQNGSMGSVQQESDQNFRDSFINTNVDSSDTQESSGDLSRAQLLEALCHSQTRAREAEKLAQKACDDKDHVVNLFFQQVPYLLAYRQWIRLLQLETLCLQLSSKDQLFAPLSSLPWVRNKGVTMRKNRCSGAAKSKPSKQRCNVRKCVFAFAIGLSLAGAGLFVGWTIAWLIPAF
ncbi:hypothetical protein ACS0TY_010552 [Phlomoides rotata]